ncbi:hypothetical protein BSL78_28011 [Apostichopus japonicus]|uniref:Fibronectin type-III domain-containing protein n=1 Tax=Stichopus japonicus TaxID=307972 RepID=A0A2G8JHE0_STIJA|nr:hypothetical protein BSL78_28011 [Apostichopus japonicus]
MTLYRNTINAQLIATALDTGLDPVQNITVSNAGGKLHVSWSPPDGLCPVHVYNVTYLLLRYKACDDDELLSQIYPPLQTNRTELTLDLYDDFAEYNISVTPFTESIAGTGVLMEGETVSMTGTTQPNVNVKLMPFIGINTKLNIWKKNKVNIIITNFHYLTYASLVFLMLLKDDDDGGGEEDDDDDDDDDNDDDDDHDHDHDHDHDDDDDEMMR